MNTEKWINFSNAILQGQGKTFVDSFLEVGQDINALEEDGFTVLSNATKFGNLGIVKYLVQIGATATNKNSNGSIPLHIAAKCGHVDIVEFFLDLGVSVDSCDNNNCTPLYYASQSGRNEVAQFLVINNADINFKTCQGINSLLVAVVNHCTDVVKFLITSGADVECFNKYNKWTAFHYASDDGCSEIVQALVDKKCDLNVKTCRGETPLWLAMRRDHREVVELLIKVGADVECYNEDKWTVFHYASKYGWLEIVQCIVNKDWDLNAKTRHGDTPLLIAARQYHRDVVELLIKSGADIECSDNEKWRVLHHAALKGMLEVVQLLVNKKCDLNVKTSYGDTPLLLAASRCRKDIVEFLIKSGADVEGSYSVTHWSLLEFASCEGWLEVLKTIIQAETDLNTGDYKNSRLLDLACESKNIETIKHLLQAGADWNDKMSLLDDIINDSSLRDPILKDVEICTQAIINNFNNKDLPSLYSLPGCAERLPPIENLKKIAHSQSVKCKIERSVEYEIKTKGYCNLREAYPMVLQLSSVKTLINYYQLKIEKSSIVDVDIYHQLSVKKRRLN